MGTERVHPGRVWQAMGTSCVMTHAALLLALGACGSPCAERRPASETPPRTEAPSEAPEPVSPAPPQAQQVGPEQLAELIDPAGHSRVRVHEAMGDRVFALVETDLMAAGFAAVEGRPDADAVEAAWEEWVRGCLGLDLRSVRCLAERAPNLAYVVDTAADGGSSWSVVVVEGGQVTRRRSLVALTLHDAGDDTVPPALHVEDLDADPRLEITVEVPLRPLRDDILYNFRDTEIGSVAYILDESLSVQARWTSTWSLAGTQDVGDSPPDSEHCTATALGQEDGSLLLEQSCATGDGESSERAVTCPYDAARDRFTCPSTLADELFRPHSRAVPHYVGETEDELRRALATP